MSLIKDLKRDHEKIQELLTSLIKWCEEAEQQSGQALVKQFSRRLQPMKELILEHHFKKEELLLFPELEKIGVSVEHGPIGILLGEHRNFKRYIIDFETALTEVKNGQQASRRYLIVGLREFIQALTAHSLKEENVLFEVAENNISTHRLLELEAALYRRDDEYYD